MSEELSARLSLPLLAAGQAQKEVLVNEAMQRIDALVQPVALSAGLAAPPASPEEGECWIVGPGAEGAWAGQEGAIAQWTAGGWRFCAPGDGWRCAILDRGTVMTFADGQWRDGATRPDGLYIGGVKLVGFRMDDIDGPDGGTIVDSQARAIINEILMVLRGHGLIGS
ncbi:MAG: DUF2793 domain-containing protein [Sphingobium sp.]